VPGATFLNDATLGPDGALYVSDSRRSVLYRFSGGKTEEWYSGPEISRPNGLLVLGTELVVGNNGDGRLKAVNLRTRAVRTLADLGAGIIDGIEAGDDGSLLVSHNEGRLFRVSQDGRVTKLLDTTAVGVPLANFAFLPAQGLLIFPTWTGNRVVAYRLDGP
jgi:sugar lactone lactonase YvrE